jgi:spore germination protein YaaH
VFVAQEGDSLASIAIAFSVDLGQLREVNPTLAGDNNAVLQPGQRINIPPFTADCGEGVVVERPSSGNCFGYSVQEGDTLFDIATMVRPRLAAPPVPLWLWEWH